VYKIDPLNYSVVRIQTFFNETPVAKATGFFVEGIGKYADTDWLVTNWHVITGRNAIDPSKILHSMSAIPNRMKLEIPSTIGPNGTSEEGKLFFHEKTVELYDAHGHATWYQHSEGSNVDVAVINLGKSCEGSLVRGINVLAAQYDMSIEIGNEIYILGYPLGFSHFANTPIWKRGSIASEPHSETPSSRNKIVIDGTTRSGMSGSPVVMRSKTHYATESGEIKAYLNATRYIGIYASRPAPVAARTEDEESAGLTSHELGYVFKKGCVDDVITKGVRGEDFGVGLKGAVSQ